jgi:hypothetical protein
LNTLKDGEHARKNCALVLSVGFLVLGSANHAAMEIFTVQLWLVSLLLLSWRSTALIKAQNLTQWPLHDDGLNNVVQWDHYSFMINGKRLFVFSGEIHYWRIPVPEIWQDLLEKIKAAGFTAFAFYSHWGYHNPNPSTLDFENGAHDFIPLLEIAKKVGLYVLVRPGPYVNAETDAGRLA